MTESRKVVLGLLDSGRYIAAATTSPFFCFEGDSEEAVKSQVEAAFAFLAKARAAAAIAPVRSHVRKQDFARLIPTGFFTPRALEAA
jgi:hypothetical protein